MNRIIFLSALTLFSFLALGQSPLPSHPEPWVLKVWFADSDHARFAATGLAPWEINYDEGYMIVETDEAGFRDLESMGFGLELDAGKTKMLHEQPGRFTNQGFAVPGYPCYRTVEETYATAQSLADNWPQLASFTDVGDSWKKTQDPNDGYDIMVLKLTNSGTGGDKPKLVISSAIHAREMATAETCTRFAEYLIEQYNVDADVTWLLDYHEVHFMLHANPDGRKEAETGAFWRKNANNNHCSNSSSRGIDLNRNFEFVWGCCNGSSTSACDDDFRGPSAASEPEAQALQNYLRSQFPDLRPDDETTPAPADAKGMFIDVHSYSELVLWSWGHRNIPAPNGTALTTLGRKLAYFNDYYPQQSVGLYPTDGTTDDFAYGELGIPGLTFELGTSFFQSCNSFESTVLPDNMAALLMAAKASRAPYLIPAGPDVLTPVITSGVAAPGDLVTVQATLTDSRYNNQNGSEPTQNIGEGACYIDIPPWEDGATPIAMTALDGVFDQVSEQAVATFNTAGLTDGRHILFVTGKDVDGNWGAPTAVFFYILDPVTAPKIEGYVRNASDNAPLEAVVSAGQFQVTSDGATGFYSLMLPEGVYDLTASASDFAPQSVTSLNAQSQTILDQDFQLQPICAAAGQDAESGIDGWSVDAPWAIDGSNAHQGTFSWTDSPGGNYGNGVNVSLTSPVLDLSGYIGLTLSFWHYYNLESGYDYGHVEYSLNGGSSWTEVENYTGVLSGWTQVQLPMSVLDGESQVKLRFRISSDNSQTRDGWHLDDMVLSGGGAQCSALPPLSSLFPMWPAQVDVTDLIQNVNQNQ